MHEKPPKTATKTKKRTYNVKPKPIHYRAVKALVENGGNVSRAMITAGYSENTAQTPAKLTSAHGFKQAMKELGLTDELLVSALVSDIQNKQNRFNELQLGFKLRGHLRENVTENKTLVLITSGESAKRYSIDAISKPDSIDTV